MHLNNDAKQWWYFLVSTIAILTVVVSITGFRIPAYRWWCGMNDDDGRKRCYLRSAWSIFFTIESFLPAFWVWHFGWVDEVDQRRWRYRRSWRAVFTAVGSFYLTIGCHKNDDHHLWRFSLGLVAMLYSSGLFL